MTLSTYRKKLFWAKYFIPKNKQKIISHLVDTSGNFHDSFYTNGRKRWPTKKLTTTITIITTSQTKKEKKNKNRKTLKQRKQPPIKQIKQNKEQELQKYAKLKKNQDKHMKHVTKQIKS